MDPILGIEGLTLSFGGLCALDNVSFAVPRGTIYSIIGPNGAGKTTIFNCISGLYRPDRGALRFEGKEIGATKPHDRARLGIARTFQNIELFDHMSAMENIMLGRHIHMKTGLAGGALMFGKKSPAAREENAHREAAERLIDFLDLQSVRNLPVGDLPYGKRKLVELARALALEPRLLLLDEPSAGMNSEEKQDLVFSIRDIRQEMGITILLIEHDMRMVMDISDRLMAINFGRVIAEGEPATVANHPDVLTAYLGEEHASVSN